ncbi:MAG: hypothetical protein HOV80_11175 [Polyangiaceae bacterium]|nr:hypothetical protein [Polyangiaceae bacterium]
MNTSDGCLLAFAVCVALASTATGCGPSKDEQCKILVSAVENADATRIGSGPSESEREKHFNDMVAAKSVLAKTEVSDEKLVALREKEWKAFEDFIHAQREILRAKVSTELDEALEKRERVMKIHEATAAELGTYCGMKVALASMSQPRAPAEPAAPEAPAATITATPPPSGAATPETWTTFRHPTEPLEAQFFEPPEVGVRKGPRSITHTAIADDDHRMFSAAYLVLPSPPTYDCNLITQTHIQGTQDNFGCKRSNETMAEKGVERTLEVTLTCSKGETMLKRVRCIPEASMELVIMLDAQAIYLTGWDPAEAKRFVDSAKLAAPTAPAAPSSPAKPRP